MLDLLRVADLKGLIKAYNLHDHINGYSKLSKSKLIEAINKHLKVDNDGYLVPNNTIFKYKIDKIAKVIPRKKEKKSDSKRLPTAIPIKVTLSKSTKDQKIRDHAFEFRNKIAQSLIDIDDVTTTGYNVEDFPRITSLLKKTTDVIQKYKQYVSDLKNGGDVNESFYDMLKLRLIDTIRSSCDIVSVFLMSIQDQVNKFKRADTQKLKNKFDDLINVFREFKDTFDADFWKADEFTKSEENAISKDKETNNDDPFDIFNADIINEKRIDSNRK